MQNREDFNEDEVKIAFGIAQQVASRQMTRSEARAYLIPELRTKPGTVDAFIAGYVGMRDGAEYQRALSNIAVEYFVNAFTRDGGPEARARALRALMLNIEFYERSHKPANGRKVFRREQRALHARLTADAVDRPPIYPDEVDSATIKLFEGAARQVSVNQYERNEAARRQAIAHYGCRCYVCNFDFESRYGALGHGFIHVHHVVDIATIGAEYQVDPVRDLRPVCPNCHAMLHTSKPAMNVDDLRQLIEQQPRMVSPQA